MRPDGVRSRGAQLRETKNATFQFEHVAGHLGIERRFLIRVIVPEADPGT